MTEKVFLEVLRGKKTKKIPFWFMRQAGRYLPEYMEVRKQAGSFLDLCFNPKLATEVTLQPLRRYDMSAAILFSDILVIPNAMGQKVSFKEGVGPVLEDMAFSKLRFDNLHENLLPIYETIKEIKSSLADDKALIGFAGAPWTIATYMVERGSSKEFINIRKLIYQKPEEFENLINIITDATIEYLTKQIESGVDAIQIFDSWAGVLTEDNFLKFSIEPTKKIVQSVKNKYPEIPIIGFPKGASILYRDYSLKTGIDGLSFDHNMPISWIKKHIKITPQGNLDPALLLVGGDQMLKKAEEIMNMFKDRAFIFNLGHGIHKDTPPENVEELALFIKNYDR